MPVLTSSKLLTPDQQDWPYQRTASTTRWPKKKDKKNKQKNKVAQKNKNKKIKNKVAQKNRKMKKTRLPKPSSSWGSIRRPGTTWSRPWRS